MYKILHIPSGEYVRHSSLDLYSEAIKYPTNKEAMIGLSRISDHVPYGRLYTSIDFIIVNPWFEKVTSMLEFEIVEE